MSSCAKYVYINFTAPNDEKYETSDLKNYFSKTNKPVIMLRTPINDFDNSFFNNIEKRFLEKGFTVRDRSLFDRILTQSQYTDYSKMAELSNTDIVIEIVGIEKTTYYNREVIDMKGKKIKIGDCNFGAYNGYRIQMKVVMIKSNSLVGTYTFNYAPDLNGIKYLVHAKGCKLTPVFKTSKDKKDKPTQTVFRNGLNSIEMELLANRISETIMNGILNGKS